MNNHLSEKMCRFLSSLVPGFEGHWKYVKTDDGISIRCEDDLDWLDSELSTIYPIICPAWQIEDVLRNAAKIEDLTKTMMLSGKICYELKFNSDTAYQKIEEYLWSVLT